jgi:hypothetical protein
MLKLTAESVYAHFVRMRPVSGRVVFITEPATCERHIIDNSFCYSIIVALNNIHNFPIYFLSLVQLVDLRRSGL